MGMMGNDAFAVSTATHTHVEFDARGLRGVAEYHVDNFGKTFFSVGFFRKDSTPAYSYDEDSNTGDDIFAVYDDTGRLTDRLYYDGYGASWGKWEFENHSLYPYIQQVKATCKALRNLEA